MRLQVTVEDRYCDTNVKAQSRIMTFELSESPKVKYFNFNWKPMCDFIIKSHIKTLYLAPFSRKSTSELQVIDLWSFTMTRGWTFYHFCRAHMGIYIRLSLTKTLYLAPLTRYSTSKVVVNDLEPFMVTECQIFQLFQKSMCDFIIVFRWKKLSILHHVREISHPSFKSLTFDLSQWPEVKYCIKIGILICDFMSDFY